MIVCDAEKLECMVHRCNDCATSSSLHEHVTAKLEEYEITDDIDFSQWDSTDRTTLRTYTSPVEEFVDMWANQAKSVQCPVRKINGKNHR